MSRMENPRLLLIFVLFYNIEGWRPFSDWSSLGWIGRLVFAKTIEYNESSPGLSSYFLPTIVFDKWKAIQSWHFVFIKLLLPEVISKKAPSNPWIADISTKKSAQGWDLHLTFILLSSKKVDGSKTKRQTNKNTWTPIHTHEQPWTSMDTHEHLSAHEHPWTHMNSKYNAAGKLLVEPYVSQFLNFLFWVVGYVNFWFSCSFLERNINSSFMFYVFFCFVLWWFRAPKKILADFCKTWFVIFILL